MKAKSSEREERLAQALRENLKRRKARVRALAGAPADAAKPAEPQSAEPRPNKALKEG